MNWISTKGAMQTLGVSATTIKRWADDGTLPSVRTAGGHRRFRPAAVENLVAQKSISQLEDDKAYEWSKMLRESENTLICEQIMRLGAKHEDWFSVADFLGQVTAEIGRLWSEGEFSVVDEHIATSRLHQVLDTISNKLPVRPESGTAFLATLSDEFHTLGLSMAQLCLRSTGLNTVWIGADTPVDELVDFIEGEHPRAKLLVLSASECSTSDALISSACTQLSAVCKALGVGFIVGGKGHWPDELGYGKRYDSFRELRETIESQTGSLE